MRSRISAESRGRPKRPLRPNAAHLRRTNCRWQRTRVPGLTRSDRHAETGQPLRPGGEDEPVARLQAGPAGGALQHAELVAQHEDLTLSVAVLAQHEIVLKTRERWLRAARVYCSQEGTPWDEAAGLVDEAAVLLGRRRGAAIDLVLDRPQLARSQA
jgi:hypothetical protein